MKNKQHNSEVVPINAHLELGEKGEELALNFLIQNGYRIVATNFTLPIGYSRKGRPISGEIDIVAYDESSMPFTLVFIEVKTRTSSDIAAPEAAVDWRKRRQIIRTARLYRRLMALRDEPFRYDVVSVIFKQENMPNIKLLRGYFSEFVSGRDFSGSQKY